MPSSATSSPAETTALVVCVSATGSHRPPSAAPSDPASRSASSEIGSGSSNSNAGGASGEEIPSDSGFAPGRGGQDTTRLSGLGPACSVWAVSSARSQCQNPPPASRGAATVMSRLAPARASIGVSAADPASTIARAFDMISTRTSRPSPLVSSSVHNTARGLPNAAPAGGSETASEDISSGAEGRAASSKASLHTSRASPHSSLVRIVRSRSQSPCKNSRTSTTSSPLNSRYSVSIFSNLSAAGAASRGVLRAPPPSSGSGRPICSGPSHAPPIVVILDVGGASCGPARVNAGPLPA